MSVILGSAEGDPDCARRVRIGAAPWRSRGHPPRAVTGLGIPGREERCLVRRLGKMPPLGTLGTPALGVPPHGGFSHRVGLRSSLPCERCSGLGMTPWSLTSRGVHSPSDPFSLPTPRVAWGQCGRRALSTCHSAGGLVLGVLRVGLGCRKDAPPGDLAGGRCPLPVRVPAVQPSGHTLGAKT